MKMEAETTKSPPGNDTSPLDTCGICKELFHSRDPKLLPCLHSFCRSCIVPKANDNGVIKCPMCQTESRLADMIDWLCAAPPRERSGTASGLGSGEGSAQEEIHICTGCEENATASSYCTDCPEWLCDQCVQAHRRVRVTKDHTIEPKDNVANRPNSASSSSSSTSGSAQSTIFCPQHIHEPLKLFCETCDKLTCRDCQLVEHKDHKYQFVNEASTQYKQFLQILLSKIKEKQTYIENAYQLIHKRHQEIEEREKVVLNDIKAFAKRLMSEVNNRGKQLVTDLHSICTAKKAQLGYKQKAIVTLSGQLAHSLMMAEKILDCNNTAAMLSSKKLLVQHLKHLLRTRCEVPNPYHVVDINLQYSEELICTYLAKQGALIVDGVTFRGAKMPKSANSPSVSAAGPSQGSSPQGQQQQQQQQQSRPLQPIAPKIVAGQGPPPNLSNLTAEQRASLIKSIAVKHLQPGSNSPTSTMTNPLFPNAVRAPPSASASSPQQGSASSSNGANSQGILGNKRFQPYMPVPQSNTVSSTQVVKTGGVYYPPSGLPPQQQQQQQQQPSSRRTLTVQQQLQQQRQRLQELRHQQQQQHRYQHHMSQIKQQMDKMVQELQHQQGSKAGSSGSQQQQQGAPLQGSQQQLHGQPQVATPGNGSSRGQGMGNPSMANAIIIQPATSSGHYSTQPGFASQTPVGNGRDQLTPSPNLRTSPLSQGSRNEVSPANSLNDGHNNGSDPMVTGVKLNSTVSGIKQEQMDLYSNMIGADGTLCIKPEPHTPGTESLPLSYPTDLSYDDSFLADLRSKPGNIHDPDVSDSAIETTQRTPPLQQSQYQGSQDQPYNLCKPITDQVIGSQSDPDGTEVLDLSRSTGTADVTKGAGSGSRPVLGTIKPVTEANTDRDTYQVTSEPLPLRDPDDPSEDYCAVCQNGGELLCCDTCPKVFHLTCHVPTLNKEPSGMWSCGLCTRESELKIEAALPRPVETTGSKRKMSMEKLLDREMKRKFGLTRYYKVCQRILLELFCNKSSPLFHEPVPKGVPNYHKIISTPMDLGTIKAKLMRSHGARYITIDDFLGDIQLVFTNCTVFNDPESQVGKAGKIMESFFHELVNKYLPYFRAWTASPHDYQVEAKEGTKAKRRKRDPSGKDGKESKGHKDKGLHPEGLRVRGKSPGPRDKPRKTQDKSNEQVEYKDSYFSTVPDADEGPRDLSMAFGGEDSEEALIRNLGLIRNQCEQITSVSAMEPEPQDLPSDPIVDPNDDDYQELREMAPLEEQAKDGTQEVPAESEGLKADSVPNKDDVQDASDTSQNSNVDEQKVKDDGKEEVPDSKPEAEKESATDEGQSNNDTDEPNPNSDTTKTVKDAGDVTESTTEEVTEEEDGEKAVEVQEKEDNADKDSSREKEPEVEATKETPSGEGSADKAEPMDTDGDKEEVDESKAAGEDSVTDSKKTEPAGLVTDNTDSKPDDVQTADTSETS